MASLDKRRTLITILGARFTVRRAIATALSAIDHEPAMAARGLSAYMVQCRKGRFTYPAMMIRSRFAAFALILAPALAACGDSQRAAARAAAAGRDGGEAGPAHRRRPRRVCRPLRRGRLRSRCARASPAISTSVHFNDGQIVKQGDLLFTIDKRPFQNALDQARANLAQARVQPRLCRGRPRARQAARARQHHHRADVRAAHAGQAQRRRRRSRRTRRRCARPSSTSNSPSCARRSPAASATAACRRAISSPAAPPATPRCSPPSCRSIRSGSSSPSTRPSYLRYERFSQQRQGGHRPRGQRHRRAQAASTRAISSTAATWISSTT